MNRLTFQFRRTQSGVNSGLIDRAAGTDYPVTQHSTTRTTGHGLIARLPGKAPDTSVLIVASVHTPALARVLTEPAEIEPFRQFLAAHDAARYFEAVVRYEIDGGRVMDARTVAARPVEP